MFFLTNAVGAQISLIILVILLKDELTHRLLNISIGVLLLCLCGTYSVALGSLAVEPAHAIGAALLAHAIIDALVKLFLTLTLIPPVKDIEVRCLRGVEVALLILFHVRVLVHLLGLIADICWFCFRGKALKYTCDHIINIF